MEEYIKKSDVQTIIDNEDNWIDMTLAISDLPTADVAPVRHGRWVRDDSGVICCSECGEEHDWDEYRATYCDACGAKMDGKEDEHEAADAN